MLEGFPETKRRAVSRTKATTVQPTVKRKPYEEHRWEDSVIRVQQHDSFTVLRLQAERNAGIVEAKGSTA